MKQKQKTESTIYMFIEKLLLSCWSEGVHQIGDLEHLFFTENHTVLETFPQVQESTRSLTII